VTAVGALLGFYLAGYTGCSRRHEPPRSGRTNAARTDLPDLGGVHVAALLILLVLLGWPRTAYARSSGLDASVLVLEVLAIAALILLGDRQLVW